MFDSPAKLALGLVTGIVFGFLLQKGRVAKFEVIVGQFLFKDWTVVKMMGTAVVVGAVGVYALVWAEMASLHVRPLLFAGVLARRSLFRHRDGNAGILPRHQCRGLRRGASRRDGRRAGHVRRRGAVRRDLPATGTGHQESRRWGPSDAAGRHAHVPVAVDRTARCGGRRRRSSSIDRGS